MLKITSKSVRDDFISLLAHLGLSYTEERENAIYFKKMYSGSVWVKVEISLSDSGSGGSADINCYVNLYCDDLEAKMKSVAVPHENLMCPNYIYRWDVAEQAYKKNNSFSHYEISLDRNERLAGDISDFIQELSAIDDHIVQTWGSDEMVANNLICALEESLTSASVNYKAPLCSAYFGRFDIAKKQCETYFKKYRRLKNKALQDYYNDIADYIDRQDK